MIAKLSRMPAGALLLLAVLGCQSPVPDGPVDAAPPPPRIPSMDGVSSGEQVMAWQCADDSLFETRFDGESDVLRLRFAGEIRELTRERDTAWSDGSVRFSSDARGVRITWQGESVPCDRVPVAAGGDPRWW